MSLQIRRGTDLQRTGIVFNEGEIVYTTDLKEVWIGDGDTIGGRKVTGEGGTGGGTVYSVDGRTGTVTLTDLYATAAQGTLADSALQSGDAISGLVNDAGYITSSDIPDAAVTTVAGKVGDVTLVKSDITDFSDSDYATAAQGTLADSALQSGDTISSLINDSGYITAAQVPADAVTTVAGKVGNVILVKSDITDFDDADYATAAQGLLASTATQPGNNVSTLTNDAGYITMADVGSSAVSSVAGKTGDVTLVKADITDFSDSDYATAAQGTLADSALQSGDAISSLTNDAGYLTSVPTQSMNDLSDVNTNGITSGQVLAWNGSTFIPADASTGAAPIDTVFGRTGAIVAVAGDYNSTLIINSSSVTGSTVTDALNTLNTNLGETNTGLNVGTGVGDIYRDKTGSTLNFKTIVAGTGITITNDTNDITINSTATGGAGEVNTASNLGSGQGVFAQKSLEDLQFKSLVAGTGVTLSSDGNSITINSTATGGASALADLNDVDVTTPSEGEVLTYDSASGDWQNKPAPSGGGSSTITSQWLRLDYAADATIKTITFSSGIEDATILDNTNSDSLSLSIKFNSIVKSMPSSFLTYGYNASLKEYNIEATKDTGSFIARPLTDSGSTIEPDFPLESLFGGNYEIHNISVTLGDTKASGTGLPPTPFDTHAYISIGW